MYLERLSSTGMDTSKYFQDPAWNHFVGTVNDLPNCVAFCVGETYEATGVPEPFKMFKDRTAGGAPTAKDWYDLWTGKKGVEPRAGGIAVWGSSTAKYGHVAFILEAEDIGAQGCRVKVCQSNFKGAYFEVKEYVIKKGVVTQGVGYPYIGTCYNDIPDKRTTRNKDVLQVDIFGDLIRARKTPNGEVYQGRYCPKGLYTILEVATVGQYGWAKLDEDTWVATDSSWAKVYPAEEESELSQANEEINRLTIQLANTEALYRKALNETENVKRQFEALKQEAEQAKKESNADRSKIEEITAKLRELLSIVGG